MENQWDFFPPQRGLRRGDPISPILFILVTQAISRMIEKAVQNQRIKGFKVGIRIGIIVSHLLLADDTLIFCGAEQDQIRYLKLILIIFEIISGLHINFQKSVICPVNAVENVQRLAETLGWNIGTFPTTYLGLPLGARYKNTSVWLELLRSLSRNWLLGYHSTYPWVGELL